MIYSKVSDLPDSLQSALKSIGYGRNDIQLEAKERVNPQVAGGDGRRGFCLIINLETGEKKEMVGSWGGSNMFNQSNAVDLDSIDYAIPLNVGVIKGTQGNKTYATITLHPNNIVGLLKGETVGLSMRDRWILYTYKSLTSAGRKNEYDRNRDKPSEEDLNRLAGLGYLKRSKNGATQITTEGKNALMLEYGYQTIEHPSRVDKV
jgi:hypothetical protein